MSKNEHVDNHYQTIQKLVRILHCLVMEHCTFTFSIKFQDDRRIIHVPANRKETNAVSSPTPNPTLAQMTQIKRQQVVEEKLDEESELEKMRPFNAAKQYIHQIVDVNLLVSNMSILAGYATRGDVFTSPEVRACRSNEFGSSNSMQFSRIPNSWRYSSFKCCTTSSTQNKAWLLFWIFINN